MILPGESSRLAREYRATTDACLDCKGCAERKSSGQPRSTLPDAASARGACWLSDSWWPPTRCAACSQSRTFEGHARIAQGRRFRGVEPQRHSVQEVAKRGASVILHDCEHLRHSTDQRQQPGCVGSVAFNFVMSVTHVRLTTVILQLVL